MQKIGPALKISSLAALAGWCAGIAYACCVMLSFGFGFDPGFLGISFWVAIALAAIVFGVWLLILLPFALLVPSRSFLWRKSLLAPLGLFCGLIIEAIGVYWNALNNIKAWPGDMYDWHVNFIHNFGYFGPPSALVGFVTGLAGALCHQRLIADQARSKAAKKEKSALGGVR